MAVKSFSKKMKITLDKANPLCYNIITKGEENSLNKKGE